METGFRNTADGGGREELRICKTTLCYLSQRVVGNTKSLNKYFLQSWSHNVRANCKARLTQTQTSFPNGRGETEIYVYGTCQQKVRVEWDSQSLNRVRNVSRCWVWPWVWGHKKWSATFVSSPTGSPKCHRSCTIQKYCVNTFSCRGPLNI